MDNEEKQNLREYIYATAEEEGITLDKVKIATDSGFQTQIRVLKKVGRDDRVVSRTSVPSNMELQRKDSSFDPVKNEFDHLVRNLKQELTERFRYKGHDFQFYPYDNGEVFCPRCEEKLELPLSRSAIPKGHISAEPETPFESQIKPQRNKEYVEPNKRRLMKKYVHGWAVRNPCDKVIENKRSLKYDISN